MNSRLTILIGCLCILFTLPSDAQHQPKDSITRSAVTEPMTGIHPNSPETVALWQDISATAGVAHDGSDYGVSFGDIDNDGDQDIYVVDLGGENKLYRNEGGGTFVDVTGSSGPVGNTGFGISSVFADFDNDGDLDLYLVNTSGANNYFRNEGSGVFVDATVGDAGDAGPGRDLAVGDVDNDGDLDIYLVRQNVANDLLRNEGEGVFVYATPAGLGDTACAPGDA